MAASHSARDCYGILGVGREVSPDALRTAYRKACLRTHPDKPGGCAARFREVVAAYETLSEPALRAAADAGGWSAGDAVHRQQARAANSAAEAAKQAELLRRAEELARSAEARRHCKMRMHVQTSATAAYHMCNPDSCVTYGGLTLTHVQAWAGVAANLAGLAADQVQQQWCGSSAGPPAADVVQAGAAAEGTAAFVQAQQQAAERMLEQARMWSTVAAAQQAQADTAQAVAQAHHVHAHAATASAAMPAADDFLAQARYWSAQATAHAALSTQPPRL